MRYGIWGEVKERETRDFFERAYRRQSLHVWDAKWNELSPQARYYFLEVVKGPTKNQAAHSQPPSVSTERFPPDVLKELVDSGFVKVEVARSRAFTDRVVANALLYDFATRIRSLRRYHLLAADQPSAIAEFVNYAFFDVPLFTVLAGVTRKAGISDFSHISETLQRYVTTHRWPGWVARALNDPVASRVVDVFLQAEGPIPLSELAGRLKGTSSDDIRAAVDKLISHLVLMEDLRPETWELMVGLLPAVREELIRANQPRERPLLVAVDSPKEFGPDGSAIVNDLHAILLEVVSDPPRLRQDHTLFQKETGRFLATLAPMAAWLLEALKWSEERRLNQVFAWARALELVKEESEGKEHRLCVTSKGQRWLSSGIDEQYATVYGLLTPAPTRSDIYSPHITFLIPSFDPYSSRGIGDTRFLGDQITVMKDEKGNRSSYYRDAKPEDYLTLRRSLDQALSMLKPGVFYLLDSVKSYLTFGQHNPLNLGLAPDRVLVYSGVRLVPPLEEQREETARLLLDAFVKRRLIPMGCVRTAIDAKGRIAIAREPLYDAYFGRKVTRSATAPDSTSTARVVVQPDFSVIVIGLNPTPAAELAPFCERTSQGGGQGAMILKVTRESVVKAVSLGLKPAEIVARLKRHASNEIPPNVLREVEDWSHWVRHVAFTTLAVLRCPDRDTADRVMGALKRQAERLNDTLVAIDQKKLTAADRTKLRNHGVIIQNHSEPPANKPKKQQKW